jgi:hypothetical protein
VSWDAFFAAEVGASAALAGLVFVGISINLSKILDLPAVANRAFQALVVLLSVLIASSAMLVPDQSLEARGVELLAVGVLATLTVNVLERDSWRRMERRYYPRLAVHTALLELSVGFYFAAGAVLIGGGTAGYAWLVPGLLVSFVLALTSAWVISIEIHR